MILKNLGESDSYANVNLRSNLIDRKMILSDIGKRIDANVARLSLQLEALIQSGRKLEEGIPFARLKGTQLLNDRDCRVDLPTG